MGKKQSLHGANERIELTINAAMYRPRIFQRPAHRELATRHCIAQLLRLDLNPESHSTRDCHLRGCGDCSKGRSPMGMGHNAALASVTDKNRGCNRRKA